MASERVLPEGTSDYASPAIDWRESRVMRSHVSVMCLPLKQSSLLPDKP